VRERAPGISRAAAIACQRQATEGVLWRDGAGLQRDGERGAEGLYVSLGGYCEGVMMYGMGKRVT
jgi:hypothetical protein